MSLERLRLSARRALALALGFGLLACSAAKGHNFDGAGGAGGAGGTGGASDGAGGLDAVAVTSATSSSTSSNNFPTTLACPKTSQQILMLDFRSGWWSGGGGGNFHTIALQAVADTCPGTTVEYHHFEISVRIKCVIDGSGGPGCQESSQPLPTTNQGILALFEKPNWDDYTQVWILSGSELDSTDVTLTGALFDHFLTQTKGSCIPVLIGAGDGFITHGNAVAQQLGIGNVLSTDFTQPGFFSVALDPAVTVNGWMTAGNQLSSHLLFQGVDQIADTVSNSQQSTHGDSVQSSSPSYEVVAHDTNGRPAIAVGSVALQGDGDRPFVIDAGFQRYYGLDQSPGTKTLLGNMVKYLASVGCKAEVPK